jgi:hypothetical protein
MGFTFQPNIVVCPHCGKEFMNNKVNGMALIEIAQSLEARKRMHCRLTLDGLERALKDDPSWPQVKKLVLDGYNDFARDLHTILGFGSEAE